MIPRAQLQRSTFDTSFSHKTTIPVGRLVPIYLEEILPGDTFNCHVNCLARLSAPLRAPIMDNMYLDFHFFFVPNRLVWEHWEEFNGQNSTAKGIQTNDYTVPYCNPSSGSRSFDFLTNYLGIPGNGSGSPYLINALPLRSVWLIWNEWYRDENLQNPAQIDFSDNNRVFVEGTKVEGLDWWQLPYRNKRHDYFTSCQPWPQKGPGVELPLGGTAPVVGNGMTLGLKSSSGYGALWAGGTSAGGTVVYGLQSHLADYGAEIGDTSTGSTVPQTSQGVGVTDEPDKSGLVADLSQATAATINTLRQAFQLQRLYERDARGGTRYTEILRAHFGVVSPDARLQRPEFLGGFSQPIMVNPVVQQSQTSADSPLGTLASFGVAGTSRRGYVKSFVEHGFVIGFVSVRADLTYQQGINRLWSRRTRFDYYWPALAHLGEQAVLMKEIYAVGGDDLAGAQDNEVFGYQERYAEYRYHPSLVTGCFNSMANKTLDYWHLAQKFETAPLLNSDFIREQPPISRVSSVDFGGDGAAPENSAVLIDCFFKQKATRCMPLYGVPGLVDHF